MLKIQEFWCDDFPKDDEIKEAIVYANTHNCVCRIIYNFIDGFAKWKNEQYVYPGDGFTKVKDLLVARIPGVGLFRMPVKEEE